MSIPKKKKYLTQLIRLKVHIKVLCDHYQLSILLRAKSTVEIQIFMLQRDHLKNYNEKSETEDTSCVCGRERTL